MLPSKIASTFNSRPAPIGFAPDIANGTTEAVGRTCKSPILLKLTISASAIPMPRYSSPTATAINLNGKMATAFVCNSSRISFAAGSVVPNSSAAASCRQAASATTFDLGFGIWDCGFSIRSFVFDFWSLFVSSPPFVVRSSLLRFPV